MYSEILNRLYITPAAFCMAYFVSLAVPIRKPVLYSVLTILIHHLLWVINRFCLGEYSILLDVLAYPLTFLLLFFFTYPQGRFRAFLTQAILAVLPVMISYILSITVLPIVSAAGMDTGDFTDPTGPYYGIMSLIVSSAGLLAMYGAARLLRVILQPVQETRDLLWFLTIPFSQILLILLFVNLSFTRTSFRGTSVCIFFGILLSFLADLACVYGYRRFRKIQFTAQQLQEAKHQLELQAEHYSGLQHDILSVNQIRHDLKNQLQAAYYLLDQGHAREARDQLDLLDLQLSRRVGSSFCENLMADAVLSEKSRLCQGKNIRLNVSALIPREIALDNVYLCSALSNLLDNAIAGTLSSDKPQGPIELSADIQRGYLVLQCVNPSRRPPRKKSRDLLRVHGLGLQILEEIAQHAQGEFRWEYKAGLYTAVLTLKK